MSDIIKLLPDHVANQIAAGEVVQRPASVVKELLENAIDAEATNISLLIKDAGKTLIQVVDDGKGMSTTDARMAFERHATSKLNTANDIFNIQTKGFRGEALASIAAVSHVELKTKNGVEDTGTKIIIEGSQIKSHEPCVFNAGTSISVKNLFYNVPARRNFLKSNPVEQRHIIDEFHRVALAHPKVAFRFIHNGNELFRLSKSKLRSRIVGIMGNKIDENLVPIKEFTELVNIQGFVAKPTFSKKTRGEQFFFVNNRFIKNSYLHHAISQAFDGLLKPKTHPSYFIYLEMNPQSIDINIHPTKTEIKFENEFGIYSILKSAVKHSLGQFNIAPLLDFERDKSLDTTYNTHKLDAKLPKIEIDKNFNPFRQNTQAEILDLKYPKQSSDGWEKIYVEIQENIETIESKHSEKELFSIEESQDFNHFQIFSKYIVKSTDEGILILHQNRAHQRVLYEQLLGQITQDAANSQQLIFPLSLELKRQDLELLKKLNDSLRLTGFSLNFSNLSQGYVGIDGIPSMLKESQIIDLLEELVASFKEGIPDSGFDLNDKLSIVLAKNMAIKTGIVLKKEEQRDLILSLFSCKEPYLSPANQPIFVNLNSKNIEKLFYT